MGIGAHRSHSGELSSRRPLIYVAKASAQDTRVSSHGSRWRWSGTGGGPGGGARAGCGLVLLPSWANPYD